MRRLMIPVLTISAIWISTAMAMECVDYRDHLHRIGTTEIGENAVLIVLVGDHAIVPVQSGLRVFDISDPRSMVLVGGCDWGSFSALAMEAEGGFLYAAGREFGDDPGNKLTVFDITDITNPVPMTSLDLDHYPRSMAIANGHLYLTLYDRLCIYDLADPAEPAQVTEYFEHCGNGLQGITIEGNLAYMVNGMPQLAILDISDPMQPRYLGGAYGTAREMENVCVKGDYAYVSNWDDGIAVYDVSDPYAPFLANEVRLTSECHFVGIKGDYLYASTSCTTDSGLWVLDASYGAYPEIVNFTALATCPHDFDFLGDRAFVVTFAYYHGSFLESVDISVPESVPGGHEWDMGTMGNSAVAYHEPFVLMSGFDDGHHYLRSSRLTSVGTVRPVGSCELPYGPVDIAMCGEYGYVSCRGVSIIGVDGSGQLQPVGRIQFGNPVEGTGQIIVRGDYAYVVTIPGGIHILDVTDPASPIDLGMRCGGVRITALKIVGDRIYLARGGTTGVGDIEIWQITDPLQPQLLGTYHVGNYIRDLDACNQRLYACTGSTMHDQLLVLDIAHPESPQLLSSLLGVSGDVTLADGVAYVAGAIDMSIVDIRNDCSPCQIGNLGYGALDMVVAGGAIVMSNNHGLVVAPRQCALEQWTTVQIDIRPGSETNVINCKGGHGMVPVAVLTTPEFDALDIDHGTVRFGPAEAREAHRPHGQARRHEVDVDGDHDLDLLFHFRNEETGIRCSDTSAELTGFTFEGGSIRGMDSIVTVPNPDEGAGDETRSIVQGPTGSDSQFRSASGCSPNPFNPSTTIWYVNEVPSSVSLVIYNMAGRRVAVLCEDIEESAGYHEVAWDGRDESGRIVPAGTYIYRLRAGDYAETERMTLIK